VASGITRQTGLAKRQAKERRKGKAGNRGIRNEENHARKPEREAAK
jgi:hypothetical protein